MATTEPQAPWDLLAVLVRRESRDQPEVLASRVCLDLLDQLVRLASLEKEVSQESREQLDQLVARESVVAQVPLELLGLRDKWDPVDQLESLELMVARESLDLPELPVLLDIKDLAACPVSVA